MPRKRVSRSPVPSSSIEPELRSLSLQRAEISDLDTRARDHGDREAAAAVRELKKNYAETLSRSLAEKFANALRADFPGILPDENGKGHESYARASKRTKKLDINYSNPMIGLGLGVSIKTLNFRDPKSQRYTKNFTRVDNEWRAEASDYHERQPYAVMIGVLFLPRDATEDAKGKHHSSFAGAVNVFRHRSGRRAPVDRTELFERLIIGLYESSEQRSLGDTHFFDVSDTPSRSGMPTKLMKFAKVVELIRHDYDMRNRVGIVYEGEASAAPTVEELVELQEDLEDDDD